MLDRGLVQVYTGPTTHENFAPMGLSLRAAGQGLKVHITAFAPFEFNSGISLLSRLLQPNLTIEGAFSVDRTPEGPAPDVMAREALERTRGRIFSGEVDVVILQDVFEPISKGIISLENILNLVENRPDRVELVLSGHNAPQEIMDHADLVTEMRLSGDLSSKGSHPSSGTPAPVEVVTGNGKGKTTYCLGRAMLASCEGVHTGVFQFIKSPKAYGEVKAAEKLPNLMIETLGEGFIFSGEKGEKKRKHLQAAGRAWDMAVRAILSERYGLIVLDEINIATHYDLIESDRIKEVLGQKPRGLHLLLSGRNAHPDVMKAASIVVEMKEIKHPLTKGIRARRGIEY